MLTLTLPAAPSLNNLYANVPGKGRVRSERYRVWFNAAGWALKSAGIRWETMRGPVAVEIVTGNQRIDLDNSAKALLDFLVDMGILADDRQVVDLHLRRGAPSKQAIVSVRAA